jgi:hypothetical protein
MSLVALLAALGVSSAMATPKGEYAVFSECAVKTPKMAGCIVSRTKSGQITLGKEEVPIVATQTLQGGFQEVGATTPFVGGLNGNTLSKTPQKVPGGLLGLVKCNEISEILERIACEVVFENGATGVNAITELAAPATSIGLNEEALLAETGTGISLPIKVRLENAFLGSECYIGSTAHPMVLNLTTGTTSPPAPNKPIKGTLGKLGEKAEGGILTITGTSLVDNSFAAPEATGCGGVLFSWLLDPIIDSKIGLPSAAGHNTAILSGGVVEQASVELVEESEK